MIAIGKVVNLLFGSTKAGRKLSARIMLFLMLGISLLGTVFVWKRMGWSGIMVIVSAGLVSGIIAREIY